MSEYKDDDADDQKVLSIPMGNLLALSDWFQILNCITSVAFVVLVLWFTKKHASVLTSSNKCIIYSFSSGLVFRCLLYMI
jgi:hypothetical protein